MPDTNPNPFVATSPLGDTLRNLSETIMSGPTQAQRIYQAESALKLQQQRMGGDSLGAGFLKYGTPEYDPRQQVNYAVQAGVNPEHVAQTERYLAANTKGVDSPEATATYVGAGGAYGSSPQGFKDATARTLAQKTYEFDNTFETMRSPDGRLVPVARNKVADAVGRGYTIQQSSDQVKANAFAPMVPGAQPQGAPPAPPPVPLTPMSPQGLPGSVQPYAAAGTSPSPAVAPQQQAPQQQPGAVSTDPMYNTQPSFQHFMGISNAPLMMVDVRTNRQGISYDGGRSVVDQASNRVEPVGGNSWVASGPEGAVGEARTAIVKSGAQNTAPVYPPWTQGEYAQSAYKASGVDAMAQKHSNALLGSLGLTRPFAGGEIGPEYERAREKLGLINQTVLTALTNSPTFAMKERQQILPLLPTDAFLTNPASEGNKVGTIVQHLENDAAALRANMTNPAVTGQLLQQTQQALMANDRALKMLTSPAQGAPGATAAPPAAASGAPQAQAQPPVPGARQAQDGNWYLNDPSRPGKYLMVR